MANFHHVRINDTIKNLAATYLQRESNLTSLVTVTSVDLYDHDSKATILLTVLPEDKVATALVVLAFTQELGGIVALAVSQNVFQHQLFVNAATAVPGFDPSLILKNGITSLRDAVPVQFQEGFLLAYNKTISEVFFIAVAFGCLTIVGAVGIDWKSVKEEKQD